MKMMFGEDGQTAGFMFSANEFVEYYLTTFDSMAAAGEPISDVMRACRNLVDILVDDQMYGTAATILMILMIRSDDRTEMSSGIVHATLEQLINSEIGGDVIEAYVASKMKNRP